MVEIGKGDVLKAEGVKTGCSARGQYFLCRVKKGMDMIKIWNDEAFTCNEGDEIQIRDILKVKKSNRQYQGKWTPDFSIVCSLKKIGESTKPDGGFTGDGSWRPFSRWLFPLR